MSSILYKLFTELDNMGFPDKYLISFTKMKNGPRDRQNYIRITVTDSETCASTKWMVSMHDLENTKLDFVKENIESMIDQVIYEGRKIEDGEDYEEK